MIAYRIGGIEYILNPAHIMFAFSDAGGYWVVLSDGSDRRIPSVVFDRIKAMDA